MKPITIMKKTGATIANSVTAAPRLRTAALMLSNRRRPVAPLALCSSKLPGKSLRIFKERRNMAVLNLDGESWNSVLLH
jgi:hypothetical protein